MTEFEKTVLEKLDNLSSEMAEMKDDIITLKRTAIMTETELVPKVNLLLDCYTSLVEKVTISNETTEKVKTLRYEVDLIKKVLQIS